jgi:hypothetical protein
MVTIIDPTDVPGTLRRIVRLQQTVADTEAAALAARRALNTCEHRTRERLQVYPALLAEFDAAPVAQQARSADHHTRAARLETLRTHQQIEGLK